MELISTVPTKNSAPGVYYLDNGSLSMFIFNQGCSSKNLKIFFSQLNFVQDFDKDPFGSSSDPFGDKKDPFADKGDPFGSADKGADVFASPEEKKDPFGASDSDPFGETKPTGQADPFAQKAQVRVSIRNTKNTAPFYEREIGKSFSVVGTCSDLDPTFSVPPL